MIWRYRILTPLAAVTVRVWCGGDTATITADTTPATETLGPSPTVLANQAATDQSNPTEAGVFVQPEDRCAVPTPIAAPTSGQTSRCRPAVPAPNPLASGQRSSVSLTPNQPNAWKAGGFEAGWGLQQMIGLDVCAWGTLWLQGNEQRVQTMQDAAITWSTTDFRRVSESVPAIRPAQRELRQRRPSHLPPHAGRRCQRRPHDGGWCRPRQRPGRPSDAP